jgi:acyl-CoA thioesterase II
VTTYLDLDAATAVAGTNGKYAMRLSDAWEIWGPNGGYLAAIALRAASMQAEIRQPASLYCHFLSSPKFDDVELQVAVLKKGRRSESLSVQMRQFGKPVLQALVRTAAHGPGYEHQQIAAPAVALPHTLKTWSELHQNDSGPKFKFWNNIEARPTNPTIPDKPQPAIARDWIRFQPRACFEDVFVDAARSLILLDTYGWPAAWRAHPDNKFIAPNLDTSIWFHRFSPQSEWLLIDHECPIATGGLLGVQGRVWDIDGQLLATGSAQLCCVPAQN